MMFSLDDNRINSIESRVSLTSVINNTPDTSVRTALLAFQDLLATQQQSIEKLKQEISRRPTKTELQGFLAQKVSIYDMSATMGALQQRIDTKATFEDIKQLIEKKDLTVVLQKHKVQINQRIDDVALELARLPHLISKVKNQLSKQVEAVNQIIGKMLRESEKEFMGRLMQTGEEIRKREQKIDQQVRELEDRTAELFNKMMIKQQVQEVRKQAPLLENEQLKATLIEFVSEIRASCEANSRQIKRLAKSLRKTASEVTQNKENFINSSNLEIGQSSKNLPVKLSDSLPRRQLDEAVSRIEQRLANMTTVQEVKDAFKSFHADISIEIERLKKEIKEKQNLGSIARNPNRLSTSRASSTRYVTAEEFSKFQTEMQLVHQCLCSENVVGRWKWAVSSMEKAATLKTQLVNTLPDIFGWARDQQCLKIKQPGLYWIAIGADRLKTNRGSQDITVFLNEQQLAQIELGYQRQDQYGLVWKQVYFEIETASRMSVLVSGLVSRLEGFIYIKKL